MKKLILLSFIVSASFQSYADSNSIDKGKALANQGYCYSCHGDKGVAPSRNAPSLAGQSAAYLAKVMYEYRTKNIHIDNKSLGMQAILKPMSNKDISNVANYYAAQQPVVPASKNKDPNDAGPCLGCHTTDGVPGLSGAAPALSGMSAMYIKRQLHAFKNKQRKNTMMNKFASKLSDEYIDQLSQFYGSK